jgi:signal peptidase II
VSQNSHRSATAGGSASGGRRGLPGNGPSEEQGREAPGGPEEPVEAAAPSAVRRRGIGLGVVIVALVVIAAIVLVLDQVSKAWAESHLDLLTPRPFLGEFLQLNLLYNSGAAWGMGSGATPIVTCLQFAIAAGVVVFAVRAVRSRWYVLALGLVLGGALGNIHDRLLRPPGPFHGEVVDFLMLPHWPVFNVADAAVVGGAVLIVVLGIVGHAADPDRREEDPDRADEDQADPDQADEGRENRRGHEA